MNGQQMDIIETAHVQVLLSELYGVLEWQCTEGVQEPVALSKLSSSLSLSLSLSFSPLRAVLQQSGHSESGGGGQAGSTASQCGHQLWAGAQPWHPPLSHLGVPQSSQSIHQEERRYYNYIIEGLAARLV